MKGNATTMFVSKAGRETLQPRHIVGQLTINGFVFSTFRPSFQVLANINTVWVVACAVLYLKYLQTSEKREDKT